MGILESELPVAKIVREGQPEFPTLPVFLTVEKASGTEASDHAERAVFTCHGGTQTFVVSSKCMYLNVT